MADFARYLAVADRSVYRMVGEYFGIDATFWSQFETRLAEFDVESAVDYASQFLDEKGYGDFQYELQQIGVGLSTKLRAHFADWVRSLIVPQPADVLQLLAIDPEARFLSFNYTATLEQLYRVPPQRILHIHGFVGNPTEALVLGHGWERRPEDSLNFEPDGPDSDWRVRDGIEHLDAFFEATFKPTRQLIDKNAAFFHSLAEVDHVRILGHGLAEVDEPYLEAVIDAVDVTRTRWTISTYNDLDERRERFGAYRIAEHLVDYRPLTAC